MGESILADFGNYFWFSNKECTVDIDPVSIDETTKETNYVLHVKAGSNEYRYGYRPKTGLVQLSKNNVVNERRKPLLAFLSLNIDQIEEVKQFIHTYGFFLSASSEEKMDVDYTELKKVVRQLKFLYEIIQELKKNEQDRDYEHLFYSTMALQFAPKMILSGGATGAVAETSYTDARSVWDRRDEELQFVDPRRITAKIYEVPDSNNGELSEELEKIFSVTPQNAINVLYFGTATIQTFVNYLIVSDPFHEEKEFLYPLEINHSSSDRPRDSQGILTGHIEDVAPHLSPCIHPGLNDLQRKIIQCFILPSDHSKQSHLVFAFMYHVEKRYGNLIGFDQEGRPIIQLNDEDKFLNADRYSSPVLREGLVEIAKETVKEMFDPVLQRVNLVYNTETMKPAWHVPDLLTEMYLSLYYMDTSAILRRCETCGQLFEVFLTNHAKKHCGERCCKAQANRKYNQKRKRSKGSVDRR